MFVLDQPFLFRDFSGTDYNCTRQGGNEFILVSY